MLRTRAEADSPVAICFVLASHSHRIPRRPRWRWAYRHARRSLLRAIDRGGGPAPRQADYAAGLRNAVASLRRRCASVPPILLLTPDAIDIPEGIDEVVRFDPAPYQRVRGVAYEFGVTVFYKLAVLRLAGFQRVVYLDSDLLVVDDISELWETARYRERDLYAVREGPVIGATHEPAFGSLNSGLMVLNAGMLDGFAHDRMLAMANGGLSLDGSDQGLFNRYLLEPGAVHRAGDLDPAFNVFAHDASLAAGLCGPSTRVLHFVGEDKPFVRPGAHEEIGPTRRLYHALAASTAARPLADGTAALLEVAAWTGRDSC